MLALLFVGCAAFGLAFVLTGALFIRGDEGGGMRHLVLLSLQRLRVWKRLSPRARVWLLNRLHICHFAGYPIYISRNLVRDEEA